ncbi:hypothetical protein Acsp04_63010 [Actinomadura sp. NBRC 104425]|nr:hypothetical protein Acsp04_63010 [Actinomadura sp. NBRC 104425]
MSPSGQDIAAIIAEDGNVVSVVTGLRSGEKGMLEAHRRARMRISRQRRAELARAGQLIRERGQRADWPVRQIAAQIRKELPEVHPLEAWRWAYGWSRAQTIAQVAQYYKDRNLGVPGLTSSMLCRYEHGEITPGPDYADALSSVYRADLADLGLERSYPRRAVTAGGAEYGAGWETASTARNGQLMANGSSSALQALHDSITLGLEVEGPAGGPQTRESLQAAVDYYALHYSASPPAVLADEVHRVRHLVNGMLAHRMADAARTELRRLAGWLSALVGNLAFHLDDRPAAMVHLQTAERLGDAVGDRWLVCWTLGARAMIACKQNRHQDAVVLGRRAHALADTPLRRAQMTAWAVLRPTAALGTSADEVGLLAAEAMDAMAAADGDLPGRFGFDLAELKLHLAEASLLVGDHTQARRHARDSIGHLPHGRPGWAAAQLVLARGEAARDGGDAAVLAGEVLDTIPAAHLRANSRERLTALVGDLAEVDTAAVRDLRERVATLPPLVPAARASAEPNGA